MQQYQYHSQEEAVYFFEVTRLHQARIEQARLSTTRQGGKAAQAQRWGREQDREWLQLLELQQRSQHECPRHPQDNMNVSDNDNGMRCCKNKLFIGSILAKLTITPDAVTLKAAQADHIIENMTLFMVATVTLIAGVFAAFIVHGS
jgi:hypothetical protein